MSDGPCFSLALSLSLPFSLSLESGVRLEKGSIRLSTQFNRISVSSFPEQRGRVASLNRGSIKLDNAPVPPEKALLGKWLKSVPLLSSLSEEERVRVHCVLVVSLMVVPGATHPNLPYFCLCCVCVCLANAGEAL